MWAGRGKGWESQGRGILPAMTVARSPDALDGRIGELLAALAGPGAVPRPDQAEAIRALVEDHRRVLVVQRTGWGKSAVYFVATRLLRERGAGPTLLVSPLLALMRDQIRAATAIGVRAATINSTNFDDWEQINQAVLAGDVDLLPLDGDVVGLEQSLDRLGHLGTDRVAAGTVRSPRRRCRC